MRPIAWIGLVAGCAALAGAHLARSGLTSEQRRILTIVGPQSCEPVAGDARHPDMAWVPGGAFTMGSSTAYPEEGPATPASVTGFWMDRTEVTNAQFTEFVAVTGYRTLAERGVRLQQGQPVIAGSSVFMPPRDALVPGAVAQWWRFVPGANWRQPQGPGSSIEGRGQYPVVHIAYEDALAYARWKGRSLPTEEQFEYAAQSSRRREPAGQWLANTWQGSFPGLDTGADGHAGAAAPVGCYPPNRLGLHDLLGNVWEWTASPYFDRHGAADSAAHPRGYDPAQPEEAEVAVLKGGSFLCSEDYCMRYRPEARIGQSTVLGTSHIGFRTVLNP
jgi:formylglycine-generating enzyme